jgi:hypothetical protein
VKSDTTIMRMRTTRDTIHDKTPISRIERDPTRRRSGGRNVREQTLNTANTAAAHLSGPSPTDMCETIAEEEPVSSNTDPRPIEEFGRADRTIDIEDR